MEEQHRRNIYKCERCGGENVTVNRDAGVTPFIVRCRKPGCEGEAQSQFYQVDQSIRPTHEWYRPTGEDLVRLESAMLAHVEQGGLVLRRIDILDLETVYGIRTRHG